MTKRESKFDENWVGVHQRAMYAIGICPAYKGIKQQVLWWVEYHSRGQWDRETNRNRDFTKEPISPTVIAKEMGVHRSSASKAISFWLKAGVLIENNEGCIGIDEQRIIDLAIAHNSKNKRWQMPTVLRPEDHDVVVKCQRKRGSSTTQMRSNGYAQRSQQINDQQDTPPTDKQKNRFTEKADSDASSKMRKKDIKRPNDNDSISSCIIECFRKTGREQPKAKEVRLILKECEGANLNPIPFIEDDKVRNPTGAIIAACRKRDDYIDRVGDFWDFHDQHTEPDEKGKENLDNILTIFNNQRK